MGDWWLIGAIFASKRILWFIWDWVIPKGICGPKGFYIVALGGFSGSYVVLWLIEFRWLEGALMALREFDDSLRIR
jgi:hypothetical protein